MGVAPSRLWGAERVSRLERGDDGWRIVEGPEFTKRDYELLAALYEHERSIGDHGQPLDEAMSPLADPLNPDGTHTYVARPIRDWADQALEDAQKDPKWSGENFSRARKWRVFKVPR